MTGLFKVATRGSALALAQTYTVTRALAARCPEIVFEVVPMRTDGDDHPGRWRDEGADAKRAFTKRLEDALLAGRADAAVHSLKDLPVDLPDGLTLGAVPARELPWDALASRANDPLRQLPSGAVVGTSSRRRAAQLRAARPDLKVAPLDGNVDTRLRKLDEGGYDAIVLAAAGLRRLGLGSRISELFPSRLMVPAVGQGALAVEVREGDSAAREIVGGLEDAVSRAEADAELAFARAIGVGCDVPAGAVARVRGGRLALLAVLCSDDGTRVLRARAEGEAGDGPQVAGAVVKSLMDRGARALLKEAVAG